MSQSRFKRRFYRQLATTFFVVTVFFCFLFSLAALTMLRKLIDRSLEVENWGLAANVAADIQPLVETTVDLERLRHTVAIFQRYAPQFQLLFLDSHGAQLTVDGSIEIPTVRHFPVEVIEAALDDTAPEPDLHTLDFGRYHGLPFSASRLTFAGKPAYLVILLRLSEFNPTASLLFASGGLRLVPFTLAVGLGISIVIAVFIFRVLTRNFFQLLDAVRSFRDGDYSKRVRIDSENELGELAAAVNEMADRIVSDMAELQRKDSLRRDLIANVAHDLRAPASGILALTDTLSLRHRSLSEAEFQRCLHGIVESGESLTRLISELFDLSRFESGEVTCDFHDIAASVLIESAAVRFQGIIRRCGITLSVVSPDNEALTRCDPFLIGRVLDNLLGNAVKFTAPGGTITLRAESVEDVIRFSVVDTGSGIPTEKLDRIFDRHERGPGIPEPVGTRSIGAEHPGSDTGRGLGLAIVSHILNLHRSTITVHSELGQGSRFLFDLPVVAIPGSPTEA